MLWKSICEEFYVGKGIEEHWEGWQIYSTFREKVREIVEQFEKYSAFPKVIGATNGILIKIKALSQMPISI